MKGLVSVIIPVFNREDSIEECLNSVTMQSYGNFEVILVDDGSADRTAEICETMAEKDPRIKFFAADHGGVSAARNMALQKAAGEYVFFLDSDDVIHPRLLESLVTALSESGAAIGGSAVVNVVENSWNRVREKLREPASPCDYTCQSHEETLSAFFTTTTPINLIGGVMMRRDLIGDSRFNTDLFIGEDYYFIYENLIKGAASVFLKKKWYYAKMHTGNSSWVFDFSGFWTRFYRRELVWKNEEKMGRTQYAALQKRDAFGCYTRCLKNNTSCNGEIKKMRKVMKDYKKELLPSLGAKLKLHYFLSVYATGIYMKLLKAKK